MNGCCYVEVSAVERSNILWNCTLGMHKIGCYREAAVGEEVIIIVEIKGLNIYNKYLVAGWEKCTDVPGLEPGTGPMFNRPNYPAANRHIFSCLTKNRAESLSSPGRLIDLFTYFMLLDTVFGPHWPQNVT